MSNRIESHRFKSEESMKLETKMPRLRELWAVVVSTLALLAFAPAMASADFGITPGTFTADVFESDGVTQFTQAGGHPATGNTSFELNHTVTPGGFFGDVYAPDGDIKNIVVDLPAGFTGDPTATPRCDSNYKILDFAQKPTQACPLAAQVGTANAKFPGLFGGGTIEFGEPVYNVAPVGDNVATFAFSVLGVIVNVNAKVRTGDDYGVRMTIPRISEALRLLSSSFTLWGVPASPAHNPQVISHAPVWAGCLELVTCHRQAHAKSTSAAAGACEFNTVA